MNMAGTSEPYWGQVRPFVLRSWDECAVAAPPDYSADTSSARYRDAHDVFAAKTAPNARAERDRALLGGQRRRVRNARRPLGGNRQRRW